MASRSLTPEDLLRGDAPFLEDRIEGAALVKLYWILKGRAEDLVRQEAFWAATNEALQHAYEELEQKTRELDDARQQLLTLNEQLEQRVRDQVVEIVRRAQEVDALNAQLQLKVQARSRELLHALERLSASGVGGELSPGQVFAERVEIMSVLGKGGMGVVYLGRDLLLRRPVALKLMSTCATTVSIRRFLTEATAASSVNHPGVVRTFHVDVTAGGHAYQIMEYVEGITLSRRLVRGPLSPWVAARLFAGLAEALAAAHAAGVVHRDIKPSNIILCATPPHARILDFGISKLFQPERPGAELTGAHEALGTPRYMSPEQILSAATVTASADIYSLGLVLYEAIAGRLPYTARNVEDLVRAHVLDEARDLRSAAPHVPDRLAALTSCCVHKEPSVRPSARALADELSAIAADGPPAEIGAAALEGIEVPTVVDHRRALPA